MQGELQGLSVSDAGMTAVTPAAALRSIVSGSATPEKTTGASETARQMIQQEPRRGVGNGDHQVDSAATIFSVDVVLSACDATSGAKTPDSRDSTK